MYEEIKTFDVEESKREICIIMELCDGGELFDFIVERGSVTEMEVSKIVRGLCDALKYLHGEGIGKYIYAAAHPYR